MNKKGIGLGPVIAFSVVVLAIFLIGTNFGLSYSKTRIVSIAKINSDKIEVNELLLDLLEIEVDNFNVADLIVLKEFDKVENILKEKLVDVNFGFRVYKDFKNVVQSEPIYSLGFPEGVIAIHNIKNYFGEDLTVSLSVKNE